MTNTLRVGVYSGQSFLYSEGGYAFSTSTPVFSSFKPVLPQPLLLLTFKTQIFIYLTCLYYKIKALFATFKTS